MSFKHLKFEDSVTMRSLEKLAVSKGLVKPETVVKTASKVEKKDFRPTNDFTLNILKLCEGLRASGFDKQASELESKFLLFKKEASDIYNTSKEVGEDLVDAAHPKGSHSLEGVEGDAVVETIVDQKKKIEDIVNKKPTGKFASNKDLLRAVKLVLAEDTEVSKVDSYVIKTLQAAKGNAVAALNEVLKKHGPKAEQRSLWQQVKDNWTLGLGLGPLAGVPGVAPIAAAYALYKALSDRIQPAINEINKVPMAANAFSIQKMNEAISNAIDVINSSKMEDADKATYTGKLTSAKGQVELANTALINQKSPEEIAAPESPEKAEESAKVEQKKKEEAQDSFLSTIKKNMSTINVFKGFINRSTMPAADKKDGLSQLDDMLGKLQKQLDLYNEYKTPEEKEVGKRLLSKSLQAITEDIKEFEKLWLE